MVNVNTYNNEEMVLIQFSGNIFLKIWIFSVVSKKSVTDTTLLIRANQLAFGSNFLYQSKVQTCLLCSM